MQGAKKFLSYIIFMRINFIRLVFFSLGYHYNKCTSDKRKVAFMYENKAAEEAIRVGSFGDGLVFLEYALSLAESEEDCDSILTILSPELLEFLASIDAPVTFSGSASSSSDVVIKFSATSLDYYSNYFYCYLDWTSASFKSTTIYIL